MTHRLDKLERRELIQRRPDLADRRGIRVVLTPSGRRLVDRAVESHVALEAKLLSGLSAKERDRLADLLRGLGFSIEGHRRGVADGGADSE
jgi:DNA-binding MarR family transcriptional regulator